MESAHATETVLSYVLFTLRSKRKDCTTLHHRCGAVWREAWPDCQALRYRTGTKRGLRVNKEHHDEREWWEKDKGATFADRRRESRAESSGQTKAR